MQDTNFKSARHLFAKIKEDFSSFDNASLIDEDTFYRDVKYILFLLGVNWYEEADEILEICNYSASIPSSFDMLEFAYRCTRADIIDQKTGVVMTKQTFSHYPEAQLDPDWHHYDCKTGDCFDRKPPSNCFFNRYEEILIQRDQTIQRYHQPTLLKIGNIDTKRMCSKGCPNIFSDAEDAMTIRSGKLYTNFKEGSVYIRYRAFPTDPDTGVFLIPDNPKIEKCLEYYIKKNILENIWVNGEADVAQKINYFENEYKKALGDAMTETKLPSFDTMITGVRNKRRKFNIYQMYS